MTHPTATRSIDRIAPVGPGSPGGDEYVPGVCNIGPWEIRRRRAFGVLGVAVAVALLLALSLASAPPWARLVVLLPLWGGVFSWLQARRRFCAGFALAGIASFGDDASGRRRVQDGRTRRADLAAAARLARDSFLVAVAFAALSVLLPS